MVDESRIYNLIETERKERRTDIAELHSRIDQILDAINNLKPKNGDNASWVRQSVGLTIAVITIISAMFVIVQGVVSPIQLQINYLKDDATSIEQRASGIAKTINDRLIIQIEGVAKTANINNNRLDERLMVELQSVEEATNLEHTRSKARIEKLEEWQKWWHRESLKDGAESP